MKELPIGTVIETERGNWVIEKVLGSGGTSLVYRIHSEDNPGECCAVKEYCPEKLFTRRDDGQLVPLLGLTGAYELLDNLTDRELTTGLLAKQMNDQVVPVERVIKEATLHIPTENGGTRKHAVTNRFGFMRDISGVGMTLSAWADLQRDENGFIPLEKVLGVMPPAASAVRKIHADKVIHGDISERNLFITGHRPDISPNDWLSAQLLDFGGALLTDDDGIALISKESVFYSTDPYGAPELTGWSNMRHVTPAADIFSLGMIFLDLLTGCIKKSSDPKVLQNDIYLSGKKRRLPEEYVCIKDAEGKPAAGEPAVRAGVNRILQKCLNPLAPRRYSCGDQLVEELDLLKALMIGDIAAEPLKRASAESRHFWQKLMLWKAALERRKVESARVYQDKYEGMNPALDGYHLDVKAVLNDEERIASSDLIIPELELFFSFENGESIDRYKNYDTRESLDSILDGLYGRTERLPNTMIFGPSGNGKSFAAARIMNRMLKSPDVVPLYLDLTRFSAEKFRGDVEQAVWRMLSRDLFRQDTARGEILLKGLCLEEKTNILLFADNLDRMSETNYGLAVDALLHIGGLPGVSVLTSGRAKERRLGEQVALQPLWAFDYVTAVCDAVRLRSENGGGKKDTNIDPFKIAKGLADILELPTALMMVMELICSGCAVSQDSADVIGKYYRERAAWVDANNPELRAIDTVECLLPELIPEFKASDRLDRNELLVKIQGASERCREKSVRPCNLPDDPETVLFVLREGLGILEYGEYGRLMFANTFAQIYFSEVYVRQAITELAVRQELRLNDWLDLCYPSWGTDVGEKFISSLRHPKKESIYYRITEQYVGFLWEITKKYDAGECDGLGDDLPYPVLRFEVILARIYDSTQPLLCDISLNDVMKRDARNLYRRMMRQPLSPDMELSLENPVCEMFLKGLARIVEKDREPDSILYRLIAAEYCVAVRAGGLGIKWKVPIVVGNSRELLKLMWHDFCIRLCDDAAKVK